MLSLELCSQDTLLQLVVDSMADRVSSKIHIQTGVEGSKMFKDSIRCGSGITSPHTAPVERQSDTLP